MLELIVATIFGAIAGALGVWQYCARYRIDDFQKTTSDTQKVIEQIRKTVTDQIINHYPPLLAAIAKQKIILQEQSRQNIAIFMSSDMFMELMNSAKVSDVEQLYDVMKDLGVPIGFLGELPIYLSELLTEAPIFVVGGIRWEL